MSDQTPRPRRGTARGLPPSRAETVLIHLALAAVTLLFGGPLLWVIAAAFDGGAGSYLPWPRDPTLSNFRELVTDLEAGPALRNSLIVSGATMLLATFAAALAGYALSRLTLRGKSGIVAGVLLLQTLPLAATMVPIYDLARRLHLRDSYLGLILVHTAIALPLLIFLMQGFFDAVPRTLEEAAWLDGASRYRAWWGVLVPAARAGVGVVAGLAFLNAWSEVLIALILIDDPGKATIARVFYATFRSAGPLSDVRYQQVAAMGVLYVLPVLALFLATRRLLVEGLTGSLHGE